MADSVTDAADHRSGAGPNVRLSSVLVVDDDAATTNLLRKGLASRFSLVEAVNDSETADELLARCHFDLIIAAVGLPGRSGVAWVYELRARDCGTPVIFMAADADVKTAIEALRSGGSDLILKPFTMDHMEDALTRTLERRRLQRENYALRRQVEHHYDSSGMVGSCEALKDICDIIKRVAPMPSTVLLEGESGTGKELAARALHHWSGRSGAFVPVNCGSMNGELLESELFGHVKGAFTGATQAREGLFSYADGGTLFLDEIGEMPLAMQTHLLRVMEERAVRPMGGNSQVTVDVRLVAATNRQLKQEVEQGRFREDLFYRLNVLGVRMPALRERVEDLPDLVRHFCNLLSSDLGVEPPAIGEAEMERLARYEWPGNIRELRNVIERALLLNSQPSQCLSGFRDTPAVVVAVDEDDLLLESVERRHILKVLAMESGNKSAAARRLGVSRKTLERKCQAWANS
ncbi:MAG: sigma-54 dependent transcriptional regulator [Gammaproteobacteria bacterium]|nr:sigma-54 dependent transcriptional regulator [Gammaproteobacteria bacterium]